MPEKDIEIRKPYTEKELAEMGILQLDMSYASYQIFGRGNERFFLDPKNGHFVLKASGHRYKM